MAGRERDTVLLRLKTPIVIGTIPTNSTNLLTLPNVPTGHLIDLGEVELKSIERAQAKNTLQDVSKRAPLPSYEQVIPHSDSTFTASDVEGTRKCIVLRKPKQSSNLAPPAYDSPSYSNATFAN